MSYTVMIHMHPPGSAIYRSAIQANGKVWGSKFEWKEMQSVLCSIFSVHPNSEEMRSLFAQIDGPFGYSAELSLTDEQARSLGWQDGECRL